MADFAGGIGDSIRGVQDAVLRIGVSVSVGDAAAQQFEREIHTFTEAAQVENDAVMDAFVERCIRLLNDGGFEVKILHTPPLDDLGHLQEKCGVDGPFGTIYVEQVRYRFDRKGVLSPHNYNVKAAYPIGDMDRLAYTLERVCWFLLEDRVGPSSGPDVWRIYATCMKCARKPR